MFWYVSRPYEIFVDTDSYSRSMRHTARRLLGAIKSGHLDVQNIEQHSSSAEDHVHTLITLNRKMGAIERYIWAMILHSDYYRTASNVMRELNGIAAADILITPHRFLRPPDDVCCCEEKHRAEIMQICPAAIRLRGDDRIRGFFGIPDNSIETMDEVKEYLNSLTA